MEYINDISINEAVIHILNSAGEKPILNQKTLELNDEIYTFLFKHIKKCINSEDLKYAIFNKSSNMISTTKQFFNSDISFLDMSYKIANDLFHLIRSKGNVSSCDLVIANISTEFGPLIGIMKMDYIKNFSHCIDKNDDKLEIDIIAQSSLPFSGQKIQKAAFIKPIKTNNEFDLMVLNKQISNKKSEEYGSMYFVNNFLDCTLIDNERDITKSFLNSSEKWTRTNFKENAEMQEKVRQAIKDRLIEEEEFNVKEIAEDIFENEPVAKEDFINSVKENTGTEKIKVDKDWINKKFKKIKLKIDKDIEISISEEAYRDNSRFEIKENGDGTINMVIKHISNYIQK